mmetsp:Transcript_31455/g.86506  ORF Transcript_31455/g.86506 Transcript_31455/m.86506 type:complete len:269 (+) Transcript_31455:801-1607(+)
MRRGKGGGGAAEAEEEASIRAGAAAAATGWRRLRGLFASVPGLRRRGGQRHRGVEPGDVSRTSQRPGAALARTCTGSRAKHPGAGRPTDTKCVAAGAERVAAHAGTAGSELATGAETGAAGADRLAADADCAATGAGRDASGTEFGVAVHGAAATGRFPADARWDAAGAECGAAVFGSAGGVPNCVGFAGEFASAARWAAGFVCRRRSSQSARCHPRHSSLCRVFRADLVAAISTYPIARRWHAIRRDRALARRRRRASFHTPRPYRR